MSARTYRLEVWDRAGAKRLAVTSRLLTATHRQVLGGEETLSVTLPRTDPVVQHLTRGSVLRVQEEGAAAFSAWRLTQRSDQRGADGATTLAVEAEALWTSLRHGLVRQRLPDGRGLLTFGLLGLTPRQWLQDFILPGYDGAGVAFALGAVQSIEPRDLSFERTTPLAALRMLEEATGCEASFTLGADGRSYTVDLLERIGSATGGTSIRYAKNLRGMERREDYAHVATRLYASGDGMLTLADAAWEVGSVSGSTGARVITWAGMSPVVEDGALVGFAFDVPGKARYPITASNWSTGRVTVDGTGRPALVAGDVGHVVVASGARLDYLESPSGVADVGVQTATFEAADVPDALNLVPAPDTPTAWARVGVEGRLPTVTASADPAHAPKGGTAARVVATEAGQGLVSAPFRITAQAERPYTALWAGLTLVAGKVRVELRDAEGKAYPLRKQPTTGTLGTYLELSAGPVHDQPLPEGLYTVAVLAHEGAAEWVLDAAMVTPVVAGDVPAFVAGSGAHLLWRRTAEELAKRVKPEREYRVDLVDLEQLDAVRWATERLALGDDVQVYDPELGAETLRVVELALDLLRAEATSVALAESAASRYADALGPGTQGEVRPPVGPQTPQLPTDAGTGPTLTWAPAPAESPDDHEAVRLVLMGAGTSTPLESLPLGNPTASGTLDGWTQASATLATNTLRDGVPVRTMRITGTAGNANAYSDRLTVEATRTYEIRVSYYGVETISAAYLGLDVYDAAGAEVQVERLRLSDHTFLPPAAAANSWGSGVVAQGEWRDMVFYLLGSGVQAAEAPAGKNVTYHVRMPPNAAAMRLRLLNNGPVGTLRRLDVWNPTITPVDTAATSAGAVRLEHRSYPKGSAPGAWIRVPDHGHQPSPIVHDVQIPTPAVGAPNVVLEARGYDAAGGESAPLYLEIDRDRRPSGTISVAVDERTGDCRVTANTTDSDSGSYRYRVAKGPIGDDAFAAVAWSDAVGDEFAGTDFGAPRLLPDAYRLATGEALYVEGYFLATTATTATGTAPPRRLRSKRVREVGQLGVRQHPAQLTSFSLAYDPPTKALIARAVAGEGTQSVVVSVEGGASVTLACLAGQEVTHSFSGASPGKRYSATAVPWTGPGATGKAGPSYGAATSSGGESLAGNALTLVAQRWGPGTGSRTLELDIQYGAGVHSVGVEYRYSSVPGGSTDRAVSYLIALAAGGGLLTHTVEDETGSARFWPADEYPIGLALTPYDSGGAAGVPTQTGVTITDLPVSSGGTGHKALPSASLMVGAGTAPITFIAPGAPSTLLRSVAGQWTASTLASGDVGTALAAPGLGQLLYSPSPYAVAFTSGGSPGDVPTLQAGGALLWKPPGASAVGNPGAGSDGRFPRSLGSGAAAWSSYTMPGSLSAGAVLIASSDTAVAALIPPVLSWLRSDAAGAAYWGAPPTPLEIGAADRTHDHAWEDIKRGTQPLPRQHDLATSHSGVLPPSMGGLGVSTSLVVGDLLYADSDHSFTRRPKGGNGLVLTMVGGVPDWAPATGGSALPASASTGQMLQWRGGAWNTSVLTWPTTLGAPNQVIVSGATGHPEWGPLPAASLATLTRGTGLTGSSYNGSGAATWAVDFGTGSNQAARGNHGHTAAEVGAATASHTHTPASIGASAVGHTHTAADVGAAAASHNHNSQYLSLSGGTVSGSIRASSFFTGSRRDLKRDIRPYADDALALIARTELVRYYLRDGSDPNERVGFIADVTDPLLAGRERDRADLQNTVGVLLRAAQQLNDRLHRLEMMSHAR